MKVSFSVLTFNSSKVVSQCIDTILAKVIATGLDYEVNVLNNGSTDDTKDVILSKKYKGNINYFENSENKSFTYGFNRLISNASGDVFCMMSDDVLLESDIVDYVVNFYSNPNNLRILLAPKSILPNGNLDRINKKELKEMDLLFGYTILGTLVKRTSAEYDQSQSCDAEVVQDSCLFFSSQIKPFFVFNQAYRFYFTEDSLSISLRKAGFTLRYETSIYVTHFLKQATKKKKNTQMNTIYMKDCITYSRRNLNPLFHFLLFIPLMTLTYCIRYVKWVLDKKDYH